MGKKFDFTTRFATFCLHSSEYEGDTNEKTYWGLRLCYRNLALNLSSPTSTGDSYSVFKKAFEDHKIDAGADGSTMEYEPEKDYVHVYVDIIRALEYLSSVVGRYSDELIKDIRDSEARDIGVALKLNNCGVFGKYPDITSKAE